MSLRDLSIGKQIGLGFVVALLFLTITGLVSTWSQREENRSMQSIYADRIVPLKGLKAIADAYAVDVIDAVNKANAGLISSEQALQAVQHARVVIDKEWRAYMATSLTPEEEALADEAKKLFDPANQAIATLINALEKTTGQTKGSLDAYDGPLYASIDLISAKITELVDLQLRVAQESTQAANSRFHTTVSLTVGMVILALITSLWLAFVITRSITRPLHQAVAQAQAVAKGDLSHNVEIESSNEIGQLQSAQQAMVESLSKVIVEVRSNAESVATASSQIEQGNADLSQRTERQASALQETAASMEEMGSTSGQNADNARQASQLAANASSVALHGGEVVEQVVRTMRDINQSSRKINDIIGVIDSIAFQTNILALNAAVEAARAGDQGRGFAVVAAEVRNLAQRSAEAAKEIKGLIGASVERVEQGSTLVDQAGDNMQNIVASIQRVSDIVNEISSASVEQSAGVAQVSAAVNQMDQATQQNAALVEESAAAATCLKHQAQMLLHSVEQFQLPSQGERAHV